MCRGGFFYPSWPAVCRAKISRPLRQQFPDTEFILHSAHSNPRLIRTARESGADAYVLKSGDFDEPIEAIRKVAR
jgi:DNA-binding NarL/FixJ family response regulator